MEKQTMEVVVRSLGEEAQKQLMRAIAAARKTGTRGRGRPKDPYVQKDRAFIAKELVFLHFTQGRTWRRALEILRARSGCAAKMGKVKDASWIIYATNFKKRQDEIKRQAR